MISEPKLVFADKKSFYFIEYQPSKIRTNYPPNKITRRTT